ncbi:MAG: choice-of-anchor L domain-containing protein [Deltaproteobacteria bacterium]|nr:choice-of-anchor L domain-containing protein [Deltaproteobacteria bacterium]
MHLRAIVVVAGLSSLGLLASCGPETGARICGGVETDTETDLLNCGRCGNACQEDSACIGGRCFAGDCQPGTVEDCYNGGDGTQDIGPCVGGTRTCEAGGTWTKCEGEVIPTGENGPACSDGIDNNCNGVVDENVDSDADGYTTCGGDCCDSTECTKPGAVNPGAFDAPGNLFDDDCNGVADDTILLCDQNIASNTTNGLDFARAIDICQTATETDKKWGVISGRLTFTDGTGVPDREAHAVRPRFGPGLLPQGGVNLAMISTGGAAAKSDTNPGYHEWEGFGTSYKHVGMQTCDGEPGTQCAAFPQDFYAANGMKLPNAPGCPEPDGTQANDPVMLTFRIRVPTNAHSFKLSSNFYSAEFPEYACSPFNDFFVVLLDSTYAGMPANPSDKNLAFFQPMGSAMKVPVGVNLAHGNTGLFTQCVNGETGCSGMSDTITTCTSTSQLTGTGFDDPNGGVCDANSLKGGATGWLVTSGNVTPGEIITLRIAIWDTSDHWWDSLAVIDGFQWSVDTAMPGTVIF